MHTYSIAYNEGLVDSSHVFTNNIFESKVKKNAAYHKRIQEGSEALGNSKLSTRKRSFANVLMLENAGENISILFAKNGRLSPESRR